MGSGVERTLAAMTGKIVRPPARGVTFLSPGALPGARRAETPQTDLALAFADAGLDFAFVPSWEPWAPRLAELLRGAGIAVMWTVAGVLWPLLEARGLAEGLRAIARDPGSLEPIMDAAAARMVVSAESGIRVGADAVVVADDMAGDAGLLVSPDFASDEVLRRLGLAVQAATRAGLPTLLHSDGDISDLLPEIRESGFQGVHAGGLAEEAFERLFNRARREGLVVLGGISTRELGEGPADAAGHGARASILASEGGLLLADDGGITSQVEYEALLVAFVAACGSV